jgi:hypothetical protein
LEIVAYSSSCYIVTGDPVMASITTSVAVEGELQPVRDSDGNLLPTPEELKTLKRVAVSLLITAYMLCVVEFAERGSYFGCKQVFANFINNPLPIGGNG